MKKKLFEFFTSDNGQASLCRLLMALIVFAYLYWGTFIIHKAPVPVIPDIPVQLAGLVAILYGFNKFGTKTP
jgi:hypothetical protein